MVLLEPYLKYLKYEKNSSSHTLLAYETDLLEWVEYLNDIYNGEAEKYYTDVSAKEIRRWILHLNKSDYKPSTVQRKMSAVRGWYTYLRIHEHIAHNPFTGIKAPQGPQTLPTFVPEQQLKKLIEELYDDYRESNEWKDLLKAFIVDVLYQTGLRRSELAGLKLSNIDLSKCELKVLGKRNKERIVPFGACLMKKIKLYLYRREDIRPNTDLLLCTEDGDPVKPALIYNLVKDALGAIPGLPKRSPHVLRHSFATSMLNHGSELVSIKELLGHAGLSTTTIYTHTSFKELQKMYNAHPRAQKQTRMNINIQANHFEPSTQLEEFVQKKVGKLERFLGDIRDVSVVLELIKPETVNNKQAKVIAYVKNDKLFADKKADTFEEAVVLATEAVERQISKYKEKISGKKK